MKANFVDKKGKIKPIIMGCYGIGLGRLLATIVEVYHDKNGIIWPENVAPFQIHLLQIGEDKALAKNAKRIYDELLSSDIEVLFDDRAEVTPGQKFADADLIGIPYRLVISAKTEKKVEVKERGKDKIRLMKLEKVMELIK